MNARESLAADRDAELIWEVAEAIAEDPEREVAAYLRSIAAELRAARIYANYLEGRDISRMGPWKKTKQAEEQTA